MVVSGIALE